MLDSCRLDIYYLNSFSNMLKKDSNEDVYKKIPIFSLRVKKT